MNLYIVRHGETQWNKQRRVQGSQDSKLTEHGRNQGKKLRPTVKNLDIDMAFYSPLGRTVETKDILTQGLNIPSVSIDELKEMDFGILEGGAIDVVNKEYPDLMNNIWNAPDKYISKGGENYTDVFTRARLALDKILSSGYKNSLIVSHGVTIAVLMAVIEGRDIIDLWEKPLVENTSISTCRYSKNKITIIDYNNTDHLTLL